MSSARTSIPRFALFGEDLRSSHEELVHCETIEARSARYGWHIPPHRHPSLSQILLVVSGHVDAILDTRRIRPEGAALIVAPPGTVHGFSFSPDVVGFVVTLSTRFLSDFADDTPPGRLAGTTGAHILDDELASRIGAIAEQILLVRDAGLEADLLRRALAESLVRIAARALPDATSDTGDDLVRRFRDLAATHGRTQRRLDFYARALGCTERTLSRRVGEALGITPMYHLHMILAAEATRLLRFTNASCSDVSDELGFADPSYFSRFYNRMTGERPSAVRGSTG